MRGPAAARDLSPGPGSAAGFRPGLPSMLPSVGRRRPAPTAPGATSRACASPLTPWARGSATSRRLLPAGKRLHLSDRVGIAFVPELHQAAPHDLLRDLFLLGRQRLAPSSRGR